MSFMSEKFMKEANRFVSEHGTENMSEEEVQKLLEQFAEEYNRNLPGTRLTEKTARTASDFLQLAEEASSDKTALRLVKKALALEPNNLDAKRLWVSLVPMDEFERYQLLQTTVQEAREQMQKQGYESEENIGHYWQILETRPYMRLLDDYVG